MQVQLLESVPNLSQLFRNNQLTASQLFSYRNSSNEIKSNIEQFIQYSLRHRTFTIQCLNLLLNAPLQQFQQSTQQSFIYNISEVFCCDQPCIAQLFFEPSTTTQNNQTNQQISEKIDMETDNIQSEAERLFENSDNEENALEQITKRDIEVCKDQIAKISLQVLSKDEFNQSCLGYLYKIWAFLIRNNANQVLGFFTQNPTCFDLLMTNMKYSLISNLIAQLLIAQDRTRQYKFEEFKKQIFSRVINTMITNTYDEDLYDGVSILLEQILNNSKQTYYEYFEDFKRQVHYLSSSDVIGEFYKILNLKQQIPFKNSLKYLQLILQRINSEKDSYSQTQSTDDMNFNIGIIITDFQKLINIIQEIGSFASITKINFITMLTELIKTPQFQRERKNYNFANILQKLITIANRQTSRGLFKIKLTNLLEQIIKITDHQIVKQFIQSQQAFYQKYFPRLKQVNFENTRLYNKDQLKAFQYKVLFEIDTKTSNSVEKASQVINKNLKRIQKCFGTKIANFGKTGSFVSLEEESGFFNFNQCPKGFGLKLDSLVQTKQSNQSNIVGKNNVSIPILHLPDLSKMGKQSSRRNNTEDKVPDEAQGRLNKFNLKLNIPGCGEQSSSSSQDNQSTIKQEQTIQKVQNVQKTRTKQQSKTDESKSDNAVKFSIIKFFIRHEILNF